MTYILEIGACRCPDQVAGPFATHQEAERWAESNGFDDYRLIVAGGTLGEQPTAAC